MTPNNKGKEDTLPTDLAFKAWEHFSSTGGTDKNTMVTVVSWLLGFSSVIVGYMVKEQFKPDSLVLRQPLPTLFLAGIGFVISIVATFVALLYGGYAKRNWGRADEIAKARGWHDLLHEPARHHGHKDRAKHIAPIFVIFAGVALMSAMVHFSILLWSIILLRSSP
jgi:hypothetical protein